MKIPEILRTTVELGSALTIRPLNEMFPALLWTKEFSIAIVFEESEVFGLIRRIVVLSKNNLFLNRSSSLKSSRKACPETIGIVDPFKHTRFKGYEKKFTSGPALSELLENVSFAIVIDLCENTVLARKPALLPSNFVLLILKNPNLSFEGFRKTHPATPSILVMFPCRAALEMNSDPKREKLKSPER